MLCNNAMKWYIYIYIYIYWCYTDEPPVSFGGHPTALKTAGSFETSEYANQLYGVTSQRTLTLILNCQEKLTRHIRLLHI
jgi:hypothetical protein